MSFSQEYLEQMTDTTLFNYHQKDIFNGLAVSLGIMSAAYIVCDMIKYFTDKTHVSVDLEARLAEIERQVKDIRNMLMAYESEEEQTYEVHETETLNQEETSNQEETPNQEETSNQEEQPEPAPATDRHAVLKQMLLGKDVYVTYKNTTFTARIADSPDAPHRYLIVCGTDYYNTPSHFSYAKKQSVNPAIKSDNGWDSVYVVTGTTPKGRPLKQSLRTFIGGSVPE